MGEGGKKPLGGSRYLIITLYWLTLVEFRCLLSTTESNDFSGTIEFVKKQTIFFPNSGLSVTYTINPTRFKNLFSSLNDGNSIFEMHIH